jgi:methionyl-tRNA formyltransferase
MRHAAHDAAWIDARRRELASRYPLASEVPRLETTSPNSTEAESFLRSVRPTLVLALCKNILAERIFSIPENGTWVCHPGICPEYRNAHGCFWALASDDVDNVGLSLIRIDRGVDTGPIFGYFRVDVDEVNETHIRIQHRVLLDNLAPIRDRLLDVVAGRQAPIDVRGRPSREWGQPWLTAWSRWKRQAGRRLRARDRA